MSEEKFVDFTGLLYYDTKIKAYIDTVTSALASSTATKEEVEEIKQRLSELEDLTTKVTRNTAQIEELFRENTENEASIVDLFKKYEDLALRVENAQTRLESVATKEDLATLQGEVNLLVDDVKELAEAFKVDHITLENLRIAVEGKADKEYVDSKIFDVSNLATKEELEKVQQLAGENSVKLFQIDSDLVDINAKLETIPSIEGLATETYVDEKFAEIVIPEVPTKVSELANDAGYITAKDVPETDLSAYSTTSQMQAAINTAVSTKADNVLFNESKFVTQPLGSFVENDDIKGLTIAQIIAKLLGLSETPVTPDEPDIPEEPVTIIDRILKDELCMYQINEKSETIPILYEYTKFDDTEYSAAPSKDYFYQKIDSAGNVVESGYQHVSDENDSMYYLIALPQGVNFNDNVSVTVWDESSNTWKDVTDSFNMSSDLQLIEDALTEAEMIMPVVPEGYTLWIDSSLDTCTGSDYRFIINE